MLANKAYPLRVRLRNRLRGEALKIYDRLQDRCLAINTRDQLSDSYSSDLKSRNRPNEGTGYRALDLIARELRLGPDEVFFDIGCGFGRTLCYFANHGVGRCVGIELRPELAAAARSNAAKLNAHIDVIEGDATEQDYSQATVIYLYNPFDANVLRQVLSRIGDQRRSAIQLCYVNPVERHVLEATEWLEEVRRFPVPYKGGKTEATIWRAHPPGITGHSGRA